VKNDAVSWISFEYAGPSPSGKTLEWLVHPKDNRDLAACLGFVKWHCPWRKYTFQPFSNTVFENDCLRDIADFCEQKTQEHPRKGGR
jgi:hypothetical protein